MFIILFYIENFNRINFGAKFNLLPHKIQADPTLLTQTCNVTFFTLTLVSGIHVSSAESIVNAVNDAINIYY